MRHTGRHQWCWLWPFLTVVSCVAGDGDEVPQLGGALPQVYTYPTADAACMETISRAGLATGELESWVTQLCSMRYLFVGGFMQSGTGLVRHLLSTHPLVRIHQNTSAQYEDEGQYLTQVFGLRRSREALSETLCSCDMCGYYCPRLQDSIVNNRNRHQLFRDWFLQFPYMTETGYGLEKTPDFLALMRNRLFPNVSSHAYPIRHPLCDSGVSVPKHEFMKRSYVPASAVQLLGPTEQLRYWLRAWQDLIVRQLPLMTGNFAVVRFESIVGNEPTYAQALWSAMGLPAFEPTPQAPADSSNDGGARGSEGRRNQRRRELFYHSTVNISSEGDLQAAIWSEKDCANFAPCNQTPRCAALLDEAREILNFFGYSPHRMVVVESGETEQQLAIWRKQDLEPLQRMRWPL